MVSFWPFKASEKSAASFEKTLADLAKKISSTTARQERLRQQTRRVRVSMILYGGFTYVLAALILILVTGWRNWSPVEYGIVGGGPVALFVLTKTATVFCEYRLSNTESQLEKLKAERESTIEMLKKVTNYNSTKQLLDKYSGEKPKPAPVTDKQPRHTPTREGRTRMPPPRTANIPRPHDIPLPPGTPPPGGSPGATIQRFPPPHADPRMSPPLPPQAQQAPVGEEFAPNAFNVQQYATAPQVFTEPRWYDRIFDALLGEDETQAKNRLALICQRCRLVNGQAPPGVRRLEDVGRWRCGGCHAWNGEENEATVILRDMSKGGAVKAEGRSSNDGGHDGSDEEDSAASDHEEVHTGEHVPLDEGPADEDEPEGTGRERPSKARKRSTRSKGAGKY